MSREPIPLPVLRGKGRDSAEKAKEYHDMRLAALEAKYQPLLNAAEENRATAEFELESLKAKLDRHPLYWKPPWSQFYWPFLGALAIAEVPVNRMSFQLFFSDGPVMSLVVAALVGVVLIALSHAAGVTSRRFRHATQEPGGGAATLFRILLLIGLIFALCYGVAVFRQGYLAFITEPDPDFAALIADDQYGEAAIVALRAGLGMDGIVFLVINLAIVTVGFFLAFNRHDPHPNFEQLDIDVATAKTAYAKIDKRRGQDIAAEERRYELERRRHGW